MRALAAVHLPEAPFPTIPTSATRIHPVKAVGPVRPATLDAFLAVACVRTFHRLIGTGFRGGLDKRPGDGPLQLTEGSG